MRASLLHRTSVWRTAFLLGNRRSCNVDDDPGAPWKSLRNPVSRSRARAIRAGRVTCPNSIARSNAMPSALFSPSSLFPASAPVEIAPCSRLTGPWRCPDMRVYTPLNWRADIYIREGRYACHSQMIRSLRTKSNATGPTAGGESKYDHPTLGSKRTGPDLARIAEKYSDARHVAHLTTSRRRAESVMPIWLVATQFAGIDDLGEHLTAMRRRVSYTDAMIPTPPTTPASHARQRSRGRRLRRTGGHADQVVRRRSHGDHGWMGSSPICRLSASHGRSVQAGVGIIGTAK